MRCTIAALAVAICSLPNVVAAQAPASTDTSPFRAGQWGVEFGLGNFASVGALRFRTPNAAWVASVSGDVQRGTSDAEATAPRFTQFDLSLGHRWHRPATPTVWQYVTVGALAGYRKSTTPTIQRVVGLPAADIITQVSSERLSGGAFADVGAQWLVTPNLALGASWMAQATVSRATGSSLFSDGTDTILGLSLGRVAIRGFLYF